MSTLESGQVFERYRIIQLLGSGVSGESYEAEDTMLLRKVTLKLIHPQATLPDSARRQFFREMQGISILNHPYLATVLDYGEIDGKLYVARRYVSNGSFLGTNGRLWFRTPLSVPDAIHYAHQLAQGLQFIHNRGSLHGALTFSNILVLRGPSLENESDYAPFLLADAGLANFVRRFGQQPHLPLPVTAAPEQLGKRVIPASDQFALAVVLYFWLAGRPPYVGTPEEIQHLKLTETITPLSTLNPRVSFEQEGMLLRALSVYPEERYPNVLAFANALLGTLKPQPQPVLRTESGAQTVPDVHAATEPAPEPVPQDVPQPGPEPDVPQPIANPVPQPSLEQDVPQPVPDDISQTVPEPAAPVPTLEPIDHGGLPAAEQLPSDQEHLPEPAGMAAYLVIVSPFIEEPYEVLLRSDETTIGRAGSSDILLDHDNLTSRHHALLKRENGRYYVYDRHSANGVQVNGQQLGGDDGCALEDGDHISIGNYELIFRLGAPKVAGEDRILATNNSSATWTGA